MEWYIPFCLSLMSLGAFFVTVGVFSEERFWFKIGVPMFLWGSLTIAQMSAYTLLLTG